MCPSVCISPAHIVFVRACACVCQLSSCVLLIRERRVNFWQILANELMTKHVKNCIHCVDRVILVKQAASKTPEMAATWWLRCKHQKIFMGLMNKQMNSLYLRWALYSRAISMTHCKQTLKQTALSRYHTCVLWGTWRLCLISNGFCLVFFFVCFFAITQFCKLSDGPNRVLKMKCDILQCNVRSIYPFFHIHFTLIAKVLISQEQAWL